MIFNLAYTAICLYIMYYSLQGVSTFKIIIGLLVFFGGGVLIVSLFAFGRNKPSTAWYVCLFIYSIFFGWYFYTESERALQKFYSFI